jgi:inosose dehydratase
MPKLTRRQWLTGVAGLAAASCQARRVSAPSPPAGCTLGIGTYAMKGMPLEKAIRTVADIGFDSIEIAVLPGYDGEPARLPAARRREVRKLLADNGLRLTALMENLPPAADDRRHKADLERLRRAMELGRDLAPDDPPLVQTVLGGGTWEAKRQLFRDRLADWLAVARGVGVAVAIKPHRGGALSRPAEAVWLIHALGDDPLLRLVFDYSHYAFRNMPLEETLRAALPWTGHVAVKDAVQRDGRVAFVLPGESGTFDYTGLLRLLRQGGYRGDVCCEVSSMVSSRPGYDPVAAARTCYRNMARAFEVAGVARF